MDTGTPDPQQFDLNVLEEYSDEESAYVAWCIETGAVATSHDPDELRALILEAIRLDIVLAMRSGDLHNFYRERAPAEVWARWHAAKQHESVKTEQFTISLPDKPRREVQSEIRIVKSNPHRVA